MEGPRQFELRDSLHFLYLVLPGDESWVLCFSRTTAEASCPWSLSLEGVWWSSGADNVGPWWCRLLWSWCFS